MSRPSRAKAQAVEPSGAPRRPHAPEGPLGRPEPWLATVLRVVVHAITAGVIAWPLTVPGAVVAAMIGGAAGSLLARFVARSPLRLPVVVLLGVAGLLAVVGLRWVLVDLDFAPGALGPSGALLAGDVVVFGLGALVVSSVLRTLSARRPSLGILEAALVAGGFATLLVAHRHGAIHRPYELADPLIASGEDPTLAILIVGALGAAVIGLLLLSERSLWRSVLHLGVVAGLLLLILGTTSMTGLPTPPSTGGALGLQDDDSEERQRAQGGAGEGNQGRRDSDELEFRDQYPSGGQAPDAVVIFHDDYSAPGGYYYFRQNAFSQYNGRKLVAATLGGLDPDVRNVFPSGRAREVAWTPPEGFDRSTVQTTVAMLADNSAPLGLEAPVRFVPASNPHPERFRRMYRVHSVSLSAQLPQLLGRSASDPSWDEQTRAHYLRGPDDPRYATMARQIVSSLPEHLRDEPLARALAITQHLGEQGTYSLRSRHAGAEDPTAHFLFGDLTGYCVHFAHAAVFLMRAAGVPARVATGYAVAEANRQGGSALLLRNSDQHAWPEVFVEGAGWVVTDVSPQTVLDPPGEPPDPQLQRLLAEMARGSEPLDDAPRPPRPMSELVRSVSRPIGLGTLATLAALLLLGYLIKGWRRLAPAFAGRQTRPRALYRASLDRLSEDGFRRRWGESPEAFARRMAASTPALPRLTRGHLAAAFGGHYEEEAVRGMSQDARALRTELGRAVPWWRRALGLFNPYSWLLSR